MENQFQSIDPSPSLRSALLRPHSDTSRQAKWRRAFASVYAACLMVPLSGCARSDLFGFYDEVGERTSAEGDRGAGGTETLLRATGGSTRGAGGLAIGGTPSAGGAPGAGGMENKPIGPEPPDPPSCFCSPTQLCDAKTGLCVCPEGHRLHPTDSSTCIVDTCLDVTCGDNSSCTIAETGLAQCDCLEEWSGPSCDQKWHDFSIPPFTKSIAFDSAGNGWFATTQGLLFWDFHDTKANTADDDWQLYPNFYEQPGFTANIDDVIIDSQDRKWFSDGYYLHRLDDRRTPSDTADDIWDHRQVIHGLFQPGIKRIRLDGDDRLWLVRHSLQGVWVISGINLPDGREPLFSSESITDLNFRGAGVWVAAKSGVHYVTLGGTRFDESDDVWTAFTSVPALLGETVSSIEVHDASGTTWFNTERGIVQLVDGGDPLDESTNTWTQWAPQLEGETWTFGPVIGVDNEAGVWLRSPEGAALRVESGGANGDSLVKYHPLDSAQYGELAQNETIYALALENDQKLWISLGATVLLFDNGGTLTDASDDRWTDFGGPVRGEFVYQLHLPSRGQLQAKTHLSDYTNTPGCGGTESLYYLDPAVFHNALDDTWAEHPLSIELPRCFTLFPPNARGQSWMKENEWFDDEEAWFLLDHGATTDLSDDTWGSWAYEPGSIFDVAGGAVEPGGGLWVGDVFYDPGSLPNDKTDDRSWISHAEAPRTLARDASGGRWFGYQIAEESEDASPFAPLRYLDDGGTLQESEDDTWVTFSSEDGLPLDQIRDIQINDWGEKWLLSKLENTEPQLARLDDGGTPQDKSDDIWSSYWTSDGLNDSWIRSLAVAPDGGVWIGTQSGLQYLELDR